MPSLYTSHNVYPKLTIFLAALSCAFGATAAEPKRIGAGDSYRVSTKSTLKGYLELPDPKANQSKRIAIDGTARVVYRERALHADSQGQIDRVFRVYDLVDYQRKVNDQ